MATTSDKRAEQNSKVNLEKRVFDNLKADEQDKNHPGLLPPQALLSTPPPSLDGNEDSTTLLSPWWSEEPLVENIEGEPVIAHTTDTDTSHLEYIPTIVNESTQEEPINTTTTLEDTIEKNEKKENVLNVSILSFGRSSPKESQIQWKERCLLLATTTNEIDKDAKDQDVQKELETIFDKSKECSMICFLKTSHALVKREEQKSIFHHFNPFYGSWISVAKTPQRCKEHLLNPGDFTKKSFTDYYTMELGEELSHSGEHVSRAVNRTFSPLQHLTQKYIDSWKDGSQQAFFSKFLSSLQKGDAFYLVRDSTKKLIENALGHDKKPSDKK